MESVMAVPVYDGEFSEKEASRLLWRAGFGPKPGEAKKLAGKGLSKAVNSLLDPPKAKMIGPEPHDDHGNFEPYDLYGHDVMWWLDKMVRSNQPLVERMALNWHDWFATGDVGSLKLSIGQAKMFRKRAFEGFDKLIEHVTTDPAMLIWLSGIDNNKWNPNENYGRELMELFMLGVSNEAGYPYSEDDVREQARALTGWRANWTEDVGYENFRFDPNYHDKGTKTIFGQSGKFDWQDSCRLCLEHEAHAPYLVEKLWSYFVPTPPDAATRAELESMYRSNYAIKPLLKAILKHPVFYEGPSMVKPPIVYIAGMLRARDVGIREDSWSWISDMAGQRPFRPPNVSGWDEQRWLDTSSYRGRWYAVSYITDRDYSDPEKYQSTTETPSEAVDKALRYWGDPVIDSATRNGLEEFCEAVEDGITENWQKDYYRGLRQNALRVMVAISPEMHTS
jgi:uncharacterized protein (DUF1800 family)